MTQLRRLAAAGLASQGRAACVAEGMNDDERGLIAATMTPEGFATPDTAAACRQAIKSYYERNKATDAEFDED